VTIEDAVALARKIVEKVALTLFLFSDPDIAQLGEKIPINEYADAIFLTLDEDALNQLDRTPRWGVASARVARVFSATQDVNIRATAALTWAVALNTIGEFREALAAARDAAARFASLNHPAKTSESLCEAAWASSFIGDVRQATQDVKAARTTDASPHLRASCDWIQARVLRSQSEFSEATKLLEKALAYYQSVPSPLLAARCERELAYTYVMSQQRGGLELLDRLQSWFENERYALDAAICALTRTNLWLESGQYAQALNALPSIQKIFADLQAEFFGAVCDRNRGLALMSLHRYPESLQASQRARDYFSAHAIYAEVSACEMNLGATYDSMNRYNEALESYGHAAELVHGEGREKREALIYLNMALIHTRQGRYSQALDLTHRALETAASKNLEPMIAACHESFAACYRELGDYDAALSHARERKAILQKQGMSRPLIPSNLSLAEILLARGERAEAERCLAEAERGAEIEGSDIYLAACHRLQARVAMLTADTHPALEKIEQARQLYSQHHRFVDAALCDLTQGETHLQRKEIAEAKKYFRRARRVLSPAFLDYAWRAEYGLGKCARALKRPAPALTHHLKAVRAMDASRASLVTEELSNDFFAGRHAVYDDALTLAFDRRRWEGALEVIELSKSRTFLALLRERGWKSQQFRDDPHIMELIEHEKESRYRLNGFRRSLVTPSSANGALRSGKGRDPISIAAQQELAAMVHENESFAARLRMAVSGLAGVPAPARFDLTQFRRATNAILGSNWAALDYYLNGDQLTVAIVRPTRLEVMRRNLNSNDRAILAACVSTETNLRETIYRGATGGEDAPGQAYLRRLTRLLIPARLDAETLIIAPHRDLHGLPFHALMSRDGFLIERHAVIYTPSLQALQLLFSQPNVISADASLVVGLSDFNDCMPALPAAGTEIEKVLALFPERAQSLWQVRATRKKIFEWNAAGELQKFKLLHFATHAVFDQAAAHQSRLYLYDEVLTTLDILDLTLNARLVTLSACQTAVGKRGPGDEALSLVRAFFYAGAQALLATQGRVQDQAAQTLTSKFYREWSVGQDAARALQTAQIEMIREGRAAHEWAPFVLFGRP